MTAETRPRSLASQAFWILMAKTLGFVFSFALPLLVVRLLDPRAFGVYKQSFLIVTTAQSILPLGFAMSAFYFLPRMPDAKARVVRNTIYFHGGVGLFAFALLSLFPGIGVWLVGTPEIAAYSPIIGAVTALWIASNFLETVATADGDVRYSTMFIAGAQFFKSAFMVAAALIWKTPEALLYAAMAQGALQFAVLGWYAQRRFPGMWGTPDLALLRTQIAYALPLGLAGVVYTMQTDLHNFFVSKRFSPETFAIYAVGCFQLPLLNLLRESLTGVLISRISALEHQGQHREVMRVLLLATSRISAFYLPVYAFLIVHGREFLIALYTKQYEASWPIFQVFLTTIPISIVVNDPALRAYERSRNFLLKLRVVLLIVLVVALHYCLDAFGLMGAVGVIVGVMIVERVAVTMKVFKVVGFQRSDWRALAPVARAALASLVAALVSKAVAPSSGPAWATVAVAAVAFGAVYAALAWKLDIVPSEYREKALTMVRRLAPAR